MSFQLIMICLSCNKINQVPYKEVTFQLEITYLT